MFDQFISKAEELRKANEPFATAMVVRREKPSSGKAGDKAIINQYGELFGWIGGGCTKSIILSEAEKAMRDGKPRFIRVSPGAEQEELEGVVSYTMTCHSGGTVDVFIEPVLPKPHIVIMGKSAIARALAKVSKALDYRVSAQAPGALPDTFEKVDELHTHFDLSTIRFSPQTFIIVATQGEQDEQALSQALSVDRPYVAFIASRKKRDVLFDYLLSTGVPEERVQAVHAPAGIDIQAKRPEEVAISILAEIIQNLRTSETEFVSFDQHRTEESERPPMYINPVCNIPVDPLTAKHVIEYKGESVYFCCDGCKASFEKEPEKYMAKV